MHFIILFGPPAVGKMTVGLSLQKLTGFNLFHNHDSIEPILKLFDFGSPEFTRLVDHFRLGVFREVANSKHEGFIFTYVWDLGSKADTDFIVKACEPFIKAKTTITFIELYAALEERLRRNTLPDRLKAKPSKPILNALKKIY